MESIKALTQKLTGYLDTKQIEQIHKAYEFASNAHSGQYRKSGDPYVSPVSYTHLTLPTKA